MTAEKVRTERMEVEGNNLLNGELLLVIDQFKELLSLRLSDSQSGRAADENSGRSASENDSRADVVTNAGWAS